MRIKGTRIALVLIFSAALSVIGFSIFYTFDSPTENKYKESKPSYIEPKRTTESISTPVRKVNYDWKRSDDMVFIHPDSEKIANNYFDGNEKLFDYAKKSAEEDCVKMEGSLSHTMSYDGINSRVMFTCTFY